MTIPTEVGTIKHLKCGVRASAGRCKEPAAWRNSNGFRYCNKHRFSTHVYAKGYEPTWERIKMKI